MSDTGMPKPDAYNRTLPPEPPPPDDPPLPKVSAALTDDETDFILSTTLRVEQRDDPLVLTFIKSYLECRSCSQASKAAKIQTHQGQTLLRKPEINACINMITQKALMKYGYDASEVIERVKEIAAIDPIEFENADGSFKTNMSQIAPESRRAIKKFKCKNIWGEDSNGMKIVIGQLIEVELWDKMKAVELLGREKNIFKETKVVQHDVTKNMASVLLGSQQKAEKRLAAMGRDVTPQIEGRTDDDKPID